MAQNDPPPSPGVSSELTKHAVPPACDDSAVLQNRDAETSLLNPIPNLITMQIGIFFLPFGLSIPLLPTHTEFPGLKHSKYVYYDKPSARTRHPGLQFVYTLGSAPPSKERQAVRCTCQRPQAGQPNKQPDPRAWDPKLLGSQAPSTIPLPPSFLNLAKPWGATATLRGNNFFQSKVINFHLLSGKKTITMKWKFFVLYQSAVTL